VSYEKVLDLLGDGTRRAIVERLRTGPATVGAIAQRLPVSRPAVSKHLALMKDAGLVTDRPLGTKRFYELRLDALARLRDYVESFWDEPLARFKVEAERGEA
jgi:DNA-binding transcriptional ArsR family regulator